VDHAAWAAAQGDHAPSAAARRLARNGVDSVSDEDEEPDTGALVEI
jgi:hypothetical protein